MPSFTTSCPACKVYFRPYVPGRHARHTVSCPQCGGVTKNCREAPAGFARLVYSRTIAAWLQACACPDPAAQAAQAAATGPVAVCASCAGVLVCQDCDEAASVFLAQIPLCGFHFRMRGGHRENHGESVWKPPS